MPVYKPSELLDFLNGLGISTKKVLSQNFLIDGNILRKIVSLAEVAPNDVVLEIGSGPGSLTEMLLDANATVIAVERDEILANALRRLEPSSSSLKIHCQDIMEFDVDSQIPNLLA